MKTASALRPIIRTARWRTPAKTSDVRRPTSDVYRARRRRDTPSDISFNFPPRDFVVSQITSRLIFRDRFVSLSLSLSLSLPLTTATLPSRVSREALKAKTRDSRSSRLDGSIRRLDSTARFDGSIRHRMITRTRNASARFLRYVRR